MDLIDTRPSPRDTGRSVDPFAPVHYSLVFRRSALPDAALHLDDPVDAAGVGRLQDNPVRVIETNGAAWLQVVDTELRAGFALLGGTERCKTEYVSALLVQELRERRAKSL
jgi:hypothetical protein